MSATDRRIVIVGDSIAGCTAARELRARGHRGSIVMIGADADGCYARPPLSKHMLKGEAAEAETWDLSDLDVTAIVDPAVSLDATRRIVTTTAGIDVPYDALIVATGASARRIAHPDQSGETVLRTFADVRALRPTLDEASTAIVVGAGFLGMEVAGACAARGTAVTVVDVDPPLQRLLGSFLSDAIVARAEAASVEFVRADAPVALVGDPVTGIEFADRTLTADLVVTCAGDEPQTGWLDGTGIADRIGVGIDYRCATDIPGIYAAGDVAYSRTASRRAPFWSNAVAQGKVAAASALGIEPTCAPTDDYFWTEILGLSIKVVGPLPLQGDPTVLEGSVDDGSALLQWSHEDGRTTIVAFGIKKPVGLLRRLARENTLSTT
ncbi:MULTISPECIES: NAD(P)/FAD-dependent oxidoreductase [unclassified Rhodococcus (in: high G+C Gram-positive bacteria)]|uniref:NAD(P)/FAD-dependent oxidoreductase n=1 Tax=unclassified Rhodococcus (in: high G+C Gram-positive bacteria) TaxID=192944 RepID=UPI0007BC609A|nr:MULTISPECIES: FAD-dependent oxidoreductase [unclassified Rhodococcus (in: high G+C Gram-positive bacteria)]KZF07004.1 ferredoxin reductase [Rhodococcus sp. EPR-147]KZF07680.1 ferredoxin reductase [Rhodococcus sp. EPR-279]